jgi:hypothetical protein
MYEESAFLISPPPVFAFAASAKFAICMFVEVFSEKGRLILPLMTSYNRSHNL